MRRDKQRVLLLRASTGSVNGSSKCSPMWSRTTVPGCSVGVRSSYAVMQPAIWDVELVVPGANDQETVMLPSVFRLAARKARFG